MDANKTAARLEKRSSVVPQSAISLEAGRIHIGANRRADDVKVDFITENDVIQTIQITCSCGREIQLKCQY